MSTPQDATSRLSILGQRQLGQAGLLVSAVGLGCMGFSQRYGPTDDRESLLTLSKAGTNDALVTYTSTTEHYLIPPCR